MRWTAGILLAAISVAALGVWLSSRASHVNQSASRAAEASATILPIELHPKAGKDLADETVREPF
jgi:hypothetical protein